MKIVRFAADSKVRYGILSGESIQAIEDKPFRYIKPVDHHYQLSEVELLSPCTPSKIVALGLNYRSHAKEVNAPLPDAPLLFLKPSTAVIGPDAPIILPRSSRRVDYEGELAVVIGKKTKDVPEDKAKGCVLGYTCFNDVSERYDQKQDGQWTRGKSFDTFAPIGPCLVTAEQIEDPNDLRLFTRVNGKIRQDSSTRLMIFDVYEIIHHLSRVMTLEPCDVIATGTPAGVAAFEKPSPRFLKPGDIVEVEIEKIGTLRNKIIQEE